MLGTSWECHKVREFALRPMGDFYRCWTLYPSRLRTWNLACHVTFFRGFCVELAWIVREFCEEVA